MMMMMMSMMMTVVRIVATMVVGEGLDDEDEYDDDGGEDCGDDGGWCKIGASKAESSRCRQAHQLHQTSTPPLYHRQQHHQLLLHQTFMNLVSPTLPLT